MSFNTENSWESAFKLTLPIFMGYLAAGIAYGMLATNAGMPAWFTVVMCFTVFSGTVCSNSLFCFWSGSSFRFSQHFIDELTFYFLYT
ncbi:AzlC family ABC transporter permease [Glaesserella parasuis]|nr:AzlC family ABC transporter permease [Glaesserella parasuis]MDE3961608.1 AzlC family ABC transporter permease [Glaesserella parasuis]